MWLTGFDVPCLHTMYLDKPMKGHTLMQAITRVNRVYADKPGGLIVDYLGIAADLKKALAFYSEAGGNGEPAHTQEQALDIMREKLEVTEAILHVFPYTEYFTADTMLLYGLMKIFPMQHAAWRLCPTLVEAERLMERVSLWFMPTISLVSEGD